MDFKRLGRETEEDAARLVEALAAVAPACITEARDEATGEVRRAVDFEALRDLLGDAAEEEDDGAEMYQFTWPGKRAARRAPPSRTRCAPTPPSRRRGRPPKISTSRVTT